MATILFDQKIMSTFDDLTVEEHRSYMNPEFGRDSSLLAKYQIPIQHFDYDYVGKCGSSSELEKMVEVLRSGQEGYYPDLLRATEEQLRKLKPNSRFLRQFSRVLSRHDLPKTEIDQINQDLQQWVEDAARTNKELNMKKDNYINCPYKVRSYPDEPLNLVKPKPECRIASTDYRAWDKFDPDAHLMKEQIEVEKIAKEAQEKLKIESSQFTIGTINQENIRKLKKSVSFNQHSTETEANVVSTQELEKGREFFRTNEYELALKCFTQSILTKPNVTNLNNRAITYLKLKNYPEALNDCDRVLAIDKRNIKALLRKAQALECMKQYEESLSVAESLIEFEPNNQDAQRIAGRVRQYCRNILKNTRLKIVEIE